MILCLAAEPAAAATAPPVSPTPAVSQEALSLKLREVRTLPVRDIQRVVVGNPDIIDFTVVSPNELLLQGKAVGSTNVILWERVGQRQLSVEVVNPSAAAVEPHLTQLLNELGLTGVTVRREAGQLFLVGQVATKDDLARVEQVTSSFQQQAPITNLVTVAPSAPAPLVVTPDMVKLGVKVVELSRSDIDRLGVDWSDNATISVNEPARGDVTFREALSKWGTGLTRSSVSLQATINALVQQNRARVLAEPTLVTSSGKEATSEVGLQVPIISSSSLQTTSNVLSTNIEYRSTGVVLKITPTVHRVGPDRRINSKIEAEISGIDRGSSLQLSVGGSSTTVPGFKIRKVNTEVTTVSNETIVIAGLLEAEDSSNTSRVPGLGSMPYIGRLFRFPDMLTSQREIVIAVTPEIMPSGEEITPDRLMAIERALGPGQSPESVNFPTQQYALQVQDRLARTLRYPNREEATNGSGRVLLTLHLQRNGQLLNAEITETSGNASFDEEALRAANDAAPYPAFPPQLDQEDVWLSLPVLFNPLAIEEALREAMSTGRAGPKPTDTLTHRYAMQVQDHLASGIKYPKRLEQVDARGQLTLRLHLQRNGKVSDVAIVESSGIPALDEAALKAAQQQAPYPSFPQDLPQQELWLDLPVLFSP